MNYIGGGRGSKKRSRKSNLYVADRNATDVFDDSEEEAFSDEIMSLGDNQGKFGSVFFFTKFNQILLFDKNFISDNQNFQLLCHLKFVLRILTLSFGRLKGEVKWKQKLKMMFFL